MALCIFHNESYKLEGQIHDFHLEGTSPHWAGCQPSTQVLFVKNVFNNEIIGSGLFLSVVEVETYSCCLIKCQMRGTHL